MGESGEISMQAVCKMGMYYWEARVYKAS